MNTGSTQAIVIGVTGASGAIYAARLIQSLIDLGHEAHVTVSPSGQTVIQHELGVQLATARLDAEEFLLRLRDSLRRFWPDGPGKRQRVDSPAVGRLHLHHHENYMAPIASGSFRTAGMVICPCSGGTLAAVAGGQSTNLIHRAASVHLKERRPLILVPRETPLSLPYLDNMRRSHEAGALLLPAMPGWYQGVQGLGDLVDFIVARILDQLRIEHGLSSRWGEA